jgi:hypothetical protein
MRRMTRFHHLWIVEAELEIRNPTSSEADTRCERLFRALERYASEDTEPYPAQVAAGDDGWLEVTFPTWAPTRLAALAAGATVLAEACATADIEPGVVRLAAGESSEELTRYDERVKSMDARG